MLSPIFVSRDASIKYGTAAGPRGCLKGGEFACVSPGEARPPVWAAEGAIGSSFRADKRAMFLQLQPSSVCPEMKKRKKKISYRDGADLR